jgi:hypothetical protein
MATTGYQAGIETSGGIVSYAKEAVWGTLPAVAFNQLRLMSESLGSNKARQRAAEIDALRQASDMVTTQFGASGAINAAMSIGTYDAFFESLFCSAFATDIMLNGTVFQSLYLQKQLGTGLFLRYPGAFVTGASIAAAVGGFVTCNFNVAAQTEAKSTAEASTGAAIGAPTGKVINTVSMTSLIQVGGVSAGAVESMSLDITNDGANPQFAIGSYLAAGMLPGVFTCSGKLRIYFKDFVLYDRFIAETEGPFSFKLTDGGTSYLFELLNSVIMNPRIVLGGPGQAVMCECDIEGRKDPVTGRMLRLTRDLTP